MVSKLSEEHRDIIYNKWLEGLNPTQIAREVKIPRSTVEWHVKKIEGMVEYRLSQVAIKEFTVTFVKVQDAIVKQIQEISKELTTTEHPIIKARLRDQIKERWLDLFRLQGDGQAVMALRKIKNEQSRISENITKGT